MQRASFKIYRDRGKAAVMVYIKLETENPRVTDAYLHTIGEAASSLGHPVEYIRDLAALHRRGGEWAVVSTAPDALMARYRYGCKVIYWAQGIWPEESYLRNRSRLRFFLSSRMEKRALACASSVFLVSNAMRTHFERKYGLPLAEKAYIMPCSNESLHPEAFEASEKYQQATFCYAGSTAPWQCFEQTIALYAKIEAKYGEAVNLLLLTADRTTAEAMVAKYGIHHCEIDYVDISGLPRKLSGVKFGFILREESPVNMVATPTKAMTYLASGVMPIYSGCLAGLDELLGSSPYCIRYPNDGSTASIEAMMGITQDAQAVLADFRAIYDAHYNPAVHLPQIARFLTRCGL